MRKVLTICAIVSLMAASQAFATAVVYTVPDAMTDTWVKLYDTGAGGESITSTDTDPAGGQTSFAGVSTATIGSWKIAIGHEYVWDVDNLDLTGYDQIQITIRNNNAPGGDKIQAKATGNCGWVSNPGDLYLAGNYAWIDPGASFTSTIDLTGLDATRKSQITKIGIEVGMEASLPNWDPDGSFTGTAFDVTVVPEPATMLLLGLGGLLLKRQREAKA